LLAVRPAPMNAREMARPDGADVGVAEAQPVNAISYRPQGGVNARVVYNDCRQMTGEPRTSIASPAA
jgi:hypothetical protein